MTKKIKPGDMYVVDHYSFHYTEKDNFGVEGKGYIKKRMNTSIIPFNSKISTPMINLLEKQLRILDEINNNPIYWIDKQNDLLFVEAGTSNNYDDYVNGNLSEIKECAFFLGNLNSRGMFMDSWDISDLRPEKDSIIKYPYYHDVSEILPSNPLLLNIGRPDVINRWIEQPTKLNMGTIDINKRNSIIFKTIEDILFMNIDFNDLMHSDSYAIYYIAKKKEPPRIIISDKTNYILNKGSVPVSIFRKPFLEKMKEFNNLEYKKGWF